MLKLQNSQILNCKTSINDNNYQVNSLRFLLFLKILFILQIKINVVCIEENLQFDTSYTSCKDEDINLLPAQVVKCPKGQVLTGFHMVTSGAPCIIWRYNFGCIETGQTNAAIKTYSTTSISVSGADVLDDFRNFNLDCPSGTAMVSFKLVNGNKYYYLFECVYAILTNCISSSTTETFCKCWPCYNSPVYLDRQKVFVGAGRALTGYSFNLNNWGLLSDCYLKFIFTHCAVTRCDSSCSSCISTPTNCRTCSAGYFKKLNGSNNYCYYNAPSGYFLNTAVSPSVYYPCDSSCQTCSLNSKKCTLCSSNFYKKENETTDFCYTSFSGYFLNINLTPNKFSACDASCKECSINAITCDVCNSNFFYKENEVSKACYSSIDGYFLNSNLTPNKFSLCITPCKTCSSLTVCLTCIDNYYLKDDEITGVCYSAKPFGYYLNSSSYNPSKYSKCDPSCNDCNTLTACINCSNGLYKKENDTSNQCFLPNVEGYYLNNKINLLSLCDSSCKFCDGNTDVKSCSSCITNYFKKENDSSNFCFMNPIGYFLKSPNNLYSLCDISCSSCNGNIDLKQCNSCSANYYKVDGYTNNYCYNTAPSGYYFDKNNPILKYIKCDISCLTCLNSASYCLTCNNSGGYFNTFETPNSCLNSPPFGYYLNVAQSKYLICDVSCNGCIENNKKCLNCKIYSSTDQKLNYFGFEIELSKCFLISQIPDGFYFNSSKLLISQCDISCKRCEKNAKYCLSCNYGYYYLVTSPSVCVSQCPVKTWTNFLEGNCSLCDASCKNCLDGTKNCLECEVGYFSLEDNKKLCFSNCPAGYIFDQENKICKKCPSKCEVCNLDNTCSKCFENYFLNKKLKQCFTKCDSGFFANRVQKICSECIYPCLECSSSNVCLSCPANLFLNPLLNELNCVNYCPDGYWADSTNNTCSECNLKCKLCKNLKTCLSCKDDFYLLKETNECLNDCTKQSYFNWENPDLKSNLNQMKITDSLKTCEKCDIGCSICSKTKNFCLACNSNYFFQEKENKCVENCPIEYYYPDYNTLKCNICHLTCKTCKGPLVNECLSCDIESGLVLKNGYCIKEGCPFGFILLDNNSCYGLKQCIELANLSVPNIFNIEADPFIAKFEFKIKEICASYKKGFEIMWDRNSTLFEKAVISKDNTIYLIKREDILEGILNLRINIFYNFKFLLISLNQTTVLVLNKLIPKIGDESMNFIYGNDLLVDASNSIDEGLLRMGKKSDPLLLFSWECPDILKSLCLGYLKPKQENNILSLKFLDYKSLLKIDIQSILKFNLILYKDKRTANKTFTILLKKNKIEISNDETNYLNFEEKYLPDFINIEKAYLGNSKFIFKINILDKNINLNNYKYSWNIFHFKSDNQYLNSNNEISLLINYSDLLEGINLISVKLTNLRTGFVISKSIEFNKDKLPHSGSCQTNKKNGISLQTSISFLADNWKSDFLPFLYKIKYLNKNNILYDLSDGGFVENNFLTNNLPVSDKFFLEVIDNQGLSVITPCKLNIKVNKNLPSIEEFLESVFDEPKKINLIEIYISNKNDNEFDAGLLNHSLDLINNYFDKITSEKFVENFDNFISTLITISNSNIDQQKINKTCEILDLIMKYYDPIYFDDNQLNSLYTIYDNMNKKFGDYLKNFQNENGKSEILSMFTILQRIINSSNVKLFDNLISGQGLIVIKNNFNIQINKISTFNTNSIFVKNTQEDILLNFKKNIRRIRRLQKQENFTYDDSNLMSINSTLLEELMKNQTVSNIGFQSQLYKNKNIPIETSKIRRIFSESSLNFSLTTLDEKNDKIKNSAENMKLTFEIRLKIPPKNKISSEIDNAEDINIGDTTCIQYSNTTKPVVSCESWYDDLSSEVVCVCDKQGFTVNVSDKALSYISKLKQFPHLTADIINIYSIGVVGFLIIIFIFFYSLANYIDNNDNRSKKYIQFYNFDKMQYYIVKFCREGFDENYSFYKLYFYLIKNLHPLISLVHLYSPSYKRNLRVLDFFLTTYISFFFTLLPFYYTDNSQLIEIAANRSIQDRNKTINDFKISIKQILQGVIYTVLSSVCTYIINTILTIVLYQDVIIEEAQKNASILNRTFRRQHNLEDYWRLKLKNAYVKIKVIVIITTKYRKNLKAIGEIAQEKIYHFKNIERNNHQKNIKTNFSFKLNLIENLKKYNIANQYKMFPHPFTKNKKLLNSKKEINSSESQKIFNEEATDFENSKIIKDLSNKKFTCSSTKSFPELQKNSLIDKKYSLYEKLNYQFEDKLSIKKTCNSLTKKRKEIQFNQTGKEKNFIDYYSLNKKLKNNFTNNFLEFKINNNRLIRKRNNQDYVLSNNISNLAEQTTINNKFYCKENLHFKDKILNFKNDLLKIENYSFCVESKNSNAKKQKQFKLITIKNRPYLFQANLEKQFSSQEISIHNIQGLDNLKILIKSHIKILLVLLIYLYLWIHLMIFIKSIYQQYGDNFFKICIMPLISLLIIKLTIIFNLMMFLSTIILYFWGDYFMKISKPPLFKFIIFKILVPPLAFLHYSALKTFRELIK